MGYSSPFQTDGNFSAIGYINLLHSLLDIWNQSPFDGFIARGKRLDMIVVSIKLQKFVFHNALDSERINQHDDIAFSTIKNNKNEVICSELILKTKSHFPVFPTKIT